MDSIEVTLQTLPTLPTAENVHERTKTRGLVMIAASTAVLPGSPDDFGKFWSKLVGTGAVGPRFTVRRTEL